jgi:8-oxo-dGTP diphosphatase
MPYQPILGTLGYILSGDRTQVLLIHRNARADDEHLGKYNGLGGKLEADESITESMRREILEESGLVVDKLILRGTISWPGFGRAGEDWLGFIFLIEEVTGEPYAHNVEGSLSWESLTKLLSGELPIWEGDKYFLPLVFDDDPRAFHGIMPYKDGRPVSWRYDRI